MPPLIDINSTEDQRDVIHRAVQALAEGGIVVFPTETVYGLAASALKPAAVARLSELKQRDAAHPFTLAIKSADHALDYIPDMSLVARRLARRCWPGPLTLVLDNHHSDSLVKQLDQHVQESVSPNGTVGLRVPAHSSVLSVLRLAAGPLVLTSANRSGQPDALTANEAVESLGDDVDLVLDDGPCKFSQPSSVVQVQDRRVSLLRSGVINDSTLRRFTSYMVLLVCTGNTCRSPMAEALMRKRIADKLGCDIHETEERGVMVMSAGIAAMAGGRATEEAVQSMSSQGLDIANHESQPINDRLIRFADLILTMTRGHREAILAQWPDAADRTHLLCRDDGEVPDPIGGPLEHYGKCASRIDSQLESWMQELDFENILADHTGS